ncbi:response regulator transcription factor [Pseudothauera rhizosphaerae]|uniref:response regulator transcription factor n=1 Tax=Pseudothauera rhizosphaerae TaxID=2565932 RepID=UPI001B3B2B5C|nr:response regulator [Pseudothauera rhizosphaerae]
MEGTNIESRKVRVLLADDERHIRQLIKAVLTTLGADVAGEAENGAEAVLLYKEQRPDVVLLDVNMPVKDGLAALREIKAFDGGAVVVMLTSLSDMGTIESALELGAAQYIRKDTPVAELRKLLVETWRDHVDPHRE